jgi:hypothetical protein
MNSAFRIQHYKCLLSLPKDDVENN